MATNDDGNPMAKLLVVLILLLLAFVFALFNVGISIAYGLRQLAWAGMTTGWFWAITLIISLGLYIGLYALVISGKESTGEAEETGDEEEEEDEQPAWMMAGIVYAVLNFGLLIFQVIFYFLGAAGWLGDMFMTAYPFLQDSPLFN